MRAKIGERVGAIRNADGKTVWLYGYGVYDGHHEPPFGPFGGEPIEGWTNPRITLDNGSVVWGCQCWWGPEDAVKNSIGGREVVIVQVEAAK